MVSITIIIIAVLVAGGLIGGAIAMGAKEDKKNMQSKTKEEAKPKIKVSLYGRGSSLASDNNNFILGKQKLNGPPEANVEKYLDELKNSAGE